MVKLLMKLSYCVLGVVIGFSWAGLNFVINELDV